MTEESTNDRAQTVHELGGADHGWLKARHHFSFADYHDPKRHGLGPDPGVERRRDRPQSGFPPHPHADMEIITYVRRARSPTRTAWATRAAPKPATCR